MRATATLRGPEARGAHGARLPDSGGTKELAQRGVLRFDPPEGHHGALLNYWASIQVYRLIAEPPGVSERDLDRALWKWNKAGMPER
jgi:hypothetical protein